jgi:hypothetical protein
MTLREEIDREIQVWLDRQGVENIIVLDTPEIASLILAIIKSKIPKEKELPPIDDNKLYELARQRIIGFNSAIDLFNKELL